MPLFGDCPGCSARQGEIDRLTKIVAHLLRMEPESAGESSVTEPADRPVIVQNEVDLDGAQYDPDTNTCTLKDGRTLPAIPGSMLSMAAASLSGARLQQAPGRDLFVMVAEPPVNLSMVSMSADDYDLEAEKALARKAEQRQVPVEDFRDA